MNGEEQAKERSYPERFPWDGELRFKFYHHSSDRPFNPSRTLTIGHSGLSFVHSEPIPVDSILILKLFGYKDYTPVRILAKVKHSDWSSLEEGYEIDCHFHDLNPTEENQVHEIVEEVCFIRRIHATVHESLDNKEHSPLLKNKSNRKNPKKTGKKKCRKKTLRRNLKK